MKLILSRKGFDSGSSGGGYASLITTNNELISLPIPDEPGVGHPTTYNQITSTAGNLGPIVSMITKGKISGAAPAHLDPDLDKGSISRTSGQWAPAFGQRDPRATRQLDDHNVGIGDLFFFFGWFCRYDLTAGRWIKDARDLHVIFGWLQVGSVFHNNNIPTMLARYPGLSEHPNAHPPCMYHSNNRIYVALPNLSLPTLNRSVLGGGVFPFRFSNVLTRPCMTRREWLLKGWATSSTTRPPLGYHDVAARWNRIGFDWELKSADRGQEFVIDTDRHPDALAWAVDLFADR